MYLAFLGLSLIFPLIGFFVKNDPNNLWIQIQLCSCLIIYFIFTVFSLFKIFSIKKSDYWWALAALLIFIPGEIIFLFGCNYSGLGIISNNELTNDFYNSLYFSVITWTTLGYGDVLPSSGVKVYATLEALIGYVYSGVMISTFFKFTQEFVFHLESK